MQRSSLFRAVQVAVVLVTATLFVSAAALQPWPVTQQALFFAALVLIASFLRIEAGEATIGFEAAVVFGALIVFHDPAVVLIAVFAGAGLYAVARRHSLYDAAQMTATYSVVALLYTLAVARDAPPMAKVAGYILLVVGYLVAHLAFASVRQSLAGDETPADFPRILAVQGRTLLLVSPIVAIAVMLDRAYGRAGFAVALLPVLLVAYVMRNETEAEQHNAELRRRNRELAILTESSTQILSAESDQETLRLFMSLLSKLARMKASVVVTWDANPDVPGAVYRFGECLPSDQEVMRWVDAAGFAQSAPSEPIVFRGALRDFPLSTGHATQIILGIQTPEVIYGILIFESEDESIATGESLDLLTLLTSQTALSLQDQLLRRETRQKTAQLEANAATMTAILDVTTSLIGQFDVDAALTRIAQAIRGSVGFDSVVFALLDRKRGDFVRRAHAGLDDVWEEARSKRVSHDEISTFFNQEFRVSNSFFVSHRALRMSEHAFFVHPGETDDGPPHADAWHENDMLLVPLMSAEQMIGYLAVRDPHDRRVPSLERVQTLEVFATQAVTALQSATQYEEIRRLTTLDSLTAAFNHRHFQDTLSKELNRHARNGRELALAMLDIDAFKKINDTFGHPVGDEILKQLVAELQRNARDTDVISRYGGEEFAIIFPDTPAQYAREAANRMRELIESHDFLVPQLRRTLHVTVSIGVAVFPQDGQTAPDLVARADAALYAAKKRGRNRVETATEVDDDGTAQHWGA